MVVRRMARETMRRRSHRQQDHHLPGNLRRGHPPDNQPLAHLTSPRSVIVCWQCHQIQSQRQRQKGLVVLDDRPDSEYLPSQKAQAPFKAPHPPTPPPVPLSLPLRHPQFLFLPRHRRECQRYCVPALGCADVIPTRCYPQPRLCTPPVLRRLRRWKLPGQCPLYGGALAALISAAGPPSRHPQAPPPRHTILFQHTMPFPHITLRRTSLPACRQCPLLFPLPPRTCDDDHRHLIVLPVPASLCQP